MVHVQFRLDGHRRRVLDALADTTGVSRSELMREAVDLLLSQRGAVPREDVLEQVERAAMPAHEVRDLRDITGWEAPTAAGLPVVDDLDDIA